MKPYLFILYLLFLCSFTAGAWHIVGGEITSTCIGDNNFRITITIYQNCDSVTDNLGEENWLYYNTDIYGNNIDNPAYYNIFDNDNGALVRSDSGEFSNYAVVPVDFMDECVINMPKTCLGKLVFEFTVNLPPNEKGYTVAYARCCRTETILNIFAPATVSAVYTCLIPAFESGECPNNSAVFNKVPPQIICANNPFSYDFSATDPDGDSLTYELCSAHYSVEASYDAPKPFEFEAPPYAVVDYLDPYSAVDPLPAWPPLQINPKTGELTGTPVAVGRYIVTVCVNEWRDGALLTSRSRDVMFIITNCSKTIVANMPQYSAEPNTYIVSCESKTVHFENISSGGDNYYWDFGVPGATSTEFAPVYTYADTGTYRVKLVVNRGSTCADSIIRLVKVYPEFKADFLYSGSLCPGDTLYFSDNSFSTYGSVSNWLWDFNDNAVSDLNNPVHAYSSSGTYTVTLAAKSSLGCVDTAERTLVIYDFDPFAGNDTIIVKGYPFRLHASGGEAYRWQPELYLSNPGIADPDAVFPDAGTYSYAVEISTGGGACVGYDTIVIQVVNDEVLFLPTAFSPNGDGLNDIFRPVLIGYSRLNFLRVYNRWGKMIFIGYSTGSGWDGTYNGQPAEGGVYFWDTVVTTPWGSEVKKSGDVTLIR